MKKFNGFLLALAAVMVFKWSVYYNMVQTPGGLALPVLFTVVISMWLFLLMNKLFKTRGDIIFILLYTIFSLIFLIDVVYYKQFNARASVIFLHQLGFVGDVKDSVNALITVHHLVAIMDIPLWIGLVVYIKRLKLDVKLNMKVLSALPIMIACILVITPFRATFSETVAKREFFSYHVMDVITTSAGGANGAVSENELLAEINYRNKIYTDEAAFKQLKYNAIAKGKNLIVVQLESFQNFVINYEYNGQEVTPNLNALIKDQSLYYNNYYEHLGLGNTSDAEFATNNGIYPTSYGQSYGLYTENTFRGVPWQLRDQGYKAMSFHGYKPEFWNRAAAYPAQGFEHFYSEADYKIDEKLGLGISDVSFFKQSVEILKGEKQPFYSFMISLSNHHPFQLPKEHQDIKLMAEEEGTLVGNYLQGIHYTDKAIGVLIEELKANGLYDNSVIVFYGDHHGLNTSDEASKIVLEKLFGRPVLFDDMLEIPLIIHMPGQGVTQTVETIGSQIDFLPTILNILGVKNDNYLIFGKDLNNTPMEGSYAAFQRCVPYGSFVSDKYIFELSNDFVFENSKAYDRVTREPVDINLCMDLYNKAKADFVKSKYIMDNDLLTKATKYIGNQYNPNKKVVLNVNSEFIPAGGGTVNDLKGTNSLEAIEESYKQGSKTIGIDFTWTEDNEIIALKNWEDIPNLFENPLKNHTRNAFMTGKMKSGLTQLDLRRVLDWLSVHEDVVLLAELNENEVAFAKLIHADYSDAEKQIVYRVQSVEAYKELYKMGITNIMVDFTTYTGNADDMINFIKENPVYGVILDRSKLTLNQINEVTQCTSFYNRFEAGYKII